MRIISSQARNAVVFAGLVFLSSPSAPAQSRVPDEHRGEVAILVVPMVGSGTYRDPIRPLFAPSALGEGGIQGWSYELSDDGKYAIVQFVARDRKSLAPLLNSGRADVKAFLKGKDSKAEIVRTIQQFKKNFDGEKLGDGR